ncbi:MAG: L,D-transpeptidase family protein [Bacteroidetes bacterium]|nr:L,D-transpeptidase family protein [Bacteroidota bacterium]
MFSIKSLTTNSQFIFIGLLGYLLMMQACNTPGEGQENKKNAIAIETTKVDMLTLRNYLSDLCNSSDSLIEIDDQKYVSLYDFKKLYASRNYEACWLTKDGVTKQASDYLEILEEIQYDGLEKNKYLSASIHSLYSNIKTGSYTLDDLHNLEASLSYSFISLTNDMVYGKDTTLQIRKYWKIKNDSNFSVANSCKKAIDENSLPATFDKLRPNNSYYKAFRNEYKRLTQLQAQSNWAIIQVKNDSLKVGDSLPELKILRKRLSIEIGLPKDTSSFFWQDDLLNAVKKFQYLNQVKTNGKLDSTTLSKLNLPIANKLKTLALNMERMRWMPLNFTQPYVWVVVPKMELDYVNQDSIQFHMKAVVGKPSRPTPTLVSKLQHIVLSPPWTVPPTIMKEEVIPGIARRGGSYLRRRGLKAYDRNGRVVSASSINSKNYRNYRIGQAPGYRSSLGEVKFNMPNPWSIYLHDTPHREDFVKNNRALSSGCVRVNKPKEFAEFLLQDSLKYSYAFIDSICKTRKTKYIPFKRDLVVYIVYLTNAMDSVGNIMYLKDIYKWDKEIR